ncbi:MAG: MotA/TolQ/ExbB proton channel family protein [Verrucomicrobia bacterium]|nr:MotA/TolQ/ExbB proton channel family protein [Verrucomicrobiota bacterium]
MNKIHDLRFVCVLLTLVIACGIWRATSPSASAASVPHAAGDVAETAPEGSPPAATAGTAAAADKPKRVLDVIQEGGWIMIPLLVVSVWCTALIVEGFVRLRPSCFAPADVMTQIQAAFREENYQQAWRVCKSRPAFLTNTLRNALECIGDGRQACENALMEHTLRETMIYRTRISYLSTIGVISPMVGLLGTVTGMIKAFQRLGIGGIGHPEELAAAIGEVLIATASGLFVAIPAFLFYYFFRNRLQMLVVMVEDTIRRLMRGVKYEELLGIQIGEGMEAQLAVMDTSAPSADATETVPCAAATASKAASGCPLCGASLSPGTAQCPHCGVALQWGQ